MIMIEKKRHACAHEGNIVNETHTKKHLHLTASLHLKHRIRRIEAGSSMKGDAGSSSHMKGDAGSSSQRFLITNEGLMQELSSLQRSPVFRDPPMSPSCENMHSERGLRKCEVFAAASKDAGDQLGSSNKIENVTGTEHHRKNYATVQENKRGLLARKIRRKRVKVLTTKPNKAVTNTGLSVRSSCSLQASKALSSLKQGASLPSAKGILHPVVDIGGLYENRCRVPWNSTNKALQVSAFQETGNVELGLTARSSACANSDINLLATADMVYTSHRKEDLDVPTSLSVKYAPKSFRDILGQHLVTQALSNALSKDRVAPMYIFYGHRGTGKTSCSKLFALALNCLSRGDRPCGTCRLCSAQISGKLSPVKEVRAGKAYGVKEIALLMKEISLSSSFLYKVCIVDECQALSVKVWNSLLKGTKAASKKTVFIFNTESIEHIPHAVVSRCQKFHFSKIKEKDIINKLRMIAMQESLEADFEAIRLIASVCNGSLYDAELILDHITLLGKKVKVPVVQDLVGLISDSTLMELLDSALSANIVDTVQSLKTFHESGVDPLNLISQLASLITRILAGGHHVPKRRLKSGFFQSKELTKDSMQRLRQALQVLSEAEKQLRCSSSGMTWLIAALLQFAPDQSYNASSNPAAYPTHRALEGTDSINDIPKGSENLQETEKQTAIHFQSRPIVSKNNVATNSSTASTINSSFQHASSPKLSHWLARAKSTPVFEAKNARIHNNRSPEADDLEQVWQRVLDAINSNNLKCFLRTQGKLVSISLHEDFKEALLEFHHLEHLSRVQRSKASILHAFQATLGHRVKVKVHLVSRMTEHRTKKDCSQHEATNFDVMPLATVMCGSERIDLDLMTSEGSTGENHEEIELKDRRAPQVVYESVPKLVNSSQKSSHDEKLHTVSAQKIVGKRPNAIKWTPQDTHQRHVWSQGNCSSLDNGINLDYIREHPEGSVDEYSLDYHTNTTSKRDSAGNCVHLNSSQNRSLARVVANKIQEENLRTESASKETACWETTNKACGLVECFQPCSKHSKFLLGLVPCASVSRSHGHPE